MDDPKWSSAIMTSGSQLEYGEALTKEVLKTMDDELLEEWAKQAAKAFYAKATSMNALETSLKKVDKDGDGIITWDQCVFALNDATDTKMKPEDIDALI